MANDDPVHVNHAYNMSPLVNNFVVALTRSFSMLPHINNTPAIPKSD
jgi:hypothetical protein